MKYILYPLVLLLILFASCGQEEENLNLEAFNTEAFAFDIGEEYEVNASVRVRGFRIEEEDNDLRSSISYDLNLVQPGGKIEDSFISKTEDMSFKENVKDAAFDIQFNLDKNYPEGKYYLVINLTDNLTGNKAATTAEFTLD
jgi:hypothetical protein